MKKSSILRINLKIFKIHSLLSPLYFSIKLKFFHNFLKTLFKKFICDQQMFSFQEEKATNFFLFFYSTIKVFPFNEKCTSLLFSNTFSNSGNSP